MFFSLKIEFKFFLINVTCCIMQMSATETMDDLVRIKYLKLEKQRFTPMIDYIKVSGVTFWEYPFLMGVHLKSQI